jgi:hypothetical protein
LTDFENAALAVFIVLLTRVIISYKLNFLIPVSKVEENMKEGQKRGAAQTGQFYFRKDVLASASADWSTKTEFSKMSINEIFNGKEAGFPGLMALIQDYLQDMDLDLETNSTIQTYLRFIGKKASGILSKRHSVGLINPRGGVSSFWRSSSDDSDLDPDVCSESFGLQAWFGRQRENQLWPDENMSRTGDWRHFRSESFDQTLRTTEPNWKLQNVRERIGGTTPGCVHLHVNLKKNRMKVEYFFPFYSLSGHSLLIRVKVKKWILVVLPLIKTPLSSHWSLTNIFVGKKFEFALEKEDSDSLQRK